MCNKQVCISVVLMNKVRSQRLVKNKYLYLLPIDQNIRGLIFIFNEGKPLSSNDKNKYLKIIILKY